MENSSYLRLIHANVNLDVKGSVEEAPLGNISGLCAALSTNGVLAARLHRSQRGISEEFLISTHQDLSSGDSSSHPRPLNQRGGGGRAQVRGSARDRADKSELRGRYICSPLTGARLHVDDFMMDEEFRRPAEHGDGSRRSGTGHKPRVDILIPTTAVQISRADPELLTGGPPAKTRVCRHNEKETRKGKGIWSQPRM